MNKIGAGQSDSLACVVNTQKPVFEYRSLSITCRGLRCARYVQRVEYSDAAMTTFLTPPDGTDKLTIEPVCNTGKILVTPRWHISRTRKHAVEAIGSASQRSNVGPG